jgi:hypothetical protein
MIPVSTCGSKDAVLAEHFPVEYKHVANIGYIRRSQTPSPLMLQSLVSGNSGVVYVRRCVSLSWQDELRRLVEEPFLVGGVDRT